MRSITRLRRFSNRRFLSYALEHYPRKIGVLMGLRRLKDYHAGHSFDFSPHRTSRLEHILKYAYQNCPYYQELFSKANVDPSDVIRGFRRIPLLDKRIIRDNLDTIISKRLPTMVYERRNTGGSTGEPLEFFASVNYDPEHQRFYYEMMGYRPGDKILVMDGTAVDSHLVGANVYWSKVSDKDLPYGSMALSSLYLNEETIPYYVNFIKSFSPAIIRGYPAFVNDIATYLLQRTSVMPSGIKAIVLTSESASGIQIHNIAEAFKTKVFLQYGHTEASVFGYTTDSTYEYYCSPVYGFVEVVDESGENVKEGELGEVVVTGFYNYAMPFIRYKTGDMAVFSGDRDGIVRLKAVIGRTQDYIYNANMEKKLLTALVFGTHFKAFARIRKWQIVQDKAGEVRIKVVREKSFTPDDEEEIRRTFLSVARVSTTFEYLDSIPLTKRGKFMFLVQNFRPGIGS